MATKLLEQLIQEAEEAAEPVGLQPDDVVHRPDEDLPVPMVASLLTSAGYVYIYDTRTGDRSITNRNMLVNQLKKTRQRADAYPGYPEGSFVFSTVKPKIERIQVTFTCLLHADRPERAHYDTMGLAVCRKANLPTQFQVLQHMQHRHRVEWATIELERTQREKVEEREFQRSLMSMAGKPQTLVLEQTAKPRRKRTRKET